MTCPVCHRRNLPGGVRCAYCGALLPVLPQFDIGSQSAVGLSSETTPANGAPATNKPGAARTAGLLGALLLLVLKGKSLLGLLKFGKIATTLSSMAVFVWADALIFGWKLGLGIAICILVHELGHVFVNWRKGIKQSAPMFIPFLGAVILIKRFPDNPTIQSESGAGGPIAGGLAALVCWGIAQATGSPYWLALAFLGFVINLFNLIPFPPLDGAHIGSVFGPKLWGAVLIALLLWVLKAPSGIVWMILVVGFLLHLGRPDDGRYLLARPLVRARMAAIYLLLCIGLGWGAQQTLAARSFVHRERERAVGLERAERPATAPVAPPDRAAAPLPQDEAFVFSENQKTVLAWIKDVGMVVCAVLLWLITARLLAAAAAQRLNARWLGLVGGMLGALLALYAGFSFFNLNGSNTGTLLGAYFAATGSALLYAGYMAARNHGARVRPSASFLLARCLAWACAGALLVAYAQSDFVVAATVALFALVFYARHPWMPAAVAARLAEAAGDYERALAFHRRALALRPDGQSALFLRAQTARINLLLDRGAAAWEVLQANAAPAATIAEGEQRAAALTLLDRYNEALVCCEQMLQAPQDDPSASLRLLIVHLRLARIALFRGWPDEARAQAEWCLRAAPKTANALVARLHVLVADACAAQNESEAARAACDRALTARREPVVQAGVAAVRAQISLQAGDHNAAEHETRRAVRLLPGHLELLYWRGRVLNALGKETPEETSLRTLAASYPNDHWGKRARADLESPTQPAPILAAASAQ